MQTVFIPLDHVRRALAASLDEIFYLGNEGKRRNCRAVGHYFVKRALPTPTIAMGLAPFVAHR